MLDANVSTGESKSVTAADVLSHASQNQQQAQTQNTTASETSTNNTAAAAVAAASQQVTGEENKKDSLSEFEAKLSLLTKKEREFFLKEKKLKELEERAKQLERLQQLKDSDPIEFLKEAGVDLEVLLKRYAEIGGKSIDEKVLELEKRYKELETLVRQKEEEARRAQMEAEVTKFKKNLEATVKSNSERWELVNNQEAYDLVFDVIDRHFTQTQQETGEGEILPIEKAADMVEAYLEERIKKVVATKKLSKFIPQPETKEQQAQAKVTSLSNAFAAGSIKQTQGQSGLLPRDEAINQIALQFKSR